MKNINRPHNGFTLLEVLLYIVISVSVIATVSVLSLQVLQARARQQIVAEVDEQSNFVLRTILDDIANAESINSPVNTSASSLSINAPGAANDPTVYALTAGQITKTTPAGTVNLTSTDIVVTNLNFEDRAAVGKPGSISIFFTTSFNGGDAQIANYDYSNNYVGSATVRR